MDIGVDFLTLTSDSVATEGVKGSVSVFAVQGVVLKDMTIKDNVGDGVTIFDGGALRIEDVTISGHSRIGVGVFEHSFVRISGGTIKENTRQGVFVQGGSRARIDNVDITDNTREGVLLSEGSSVFIGAGSMITGNDRDGLSVAENSTARIDDVTISDSGRRAIFVRDAGVLRASNSTIGSDNPDSSPNPYAILVVRGSILNLAGGNAVSNTAVEPGGGTAINVTTGSSMRQGNVFGDPGSISATNRALTLSNQSFADLRDFTVTGDVRVLRNSLLRLEKDDTGLVTGNIEVGQDSAVSFRLDGSGSVEVTGTVTCLDTESSADFGGQSAADIVGGNGKELDCSGYGPGNSKP